MDCKIATRSVQCIDTYGSGEVILLIMATGWKILSGCCDREKIWMVFLAVLLPKHGGGDVSIN